MVLNPKKFKETWNIDRGLRNVLTSIDIKNKGVARSSGVDINGKATKPFPI
jgi:hypothetical protein